MDWAQVFRTHRPYARRILMWRVLSACFLLVGLVILAVVVLRGAEQWRRIAGAVMGGLICAGAAWMFRRGQGIAAAPLLVVRGSITALTPGDYDVPSSLQMTVTEAFEFGASGQTNPASKHAGNQRLNVPDYEVFKMLSEGKANVNDVQLLCLPDGAVISLLEDALRRVNG